MQQSTISSRLRRCGPTSGSRFLRPPRAWQRGKPAAVDTIKELLSDLEPLEAFFAYPGSSLLGRLRAKLSEGDAKRFYFLAQRISSAIISQDFKHDPAEWESSDEVADVPADRLPPAFGGSAAFRPYFEVLFVTPHQPSRWQHMIHEIRRLRRPEDEFIYEPLIVGSAEDAVAAAIVNPDLAAIALYEGFALRTNRRRR